MAVFSTTTPYGVTEPAYHRFTHSPVSSGFSALLASLAAYIEAERDIADAAAFDPAFADWLRDAEAARAAVLVRLAQIHSSLVTRSEDLPLKAMALLCQRLILSDSTMSFMAAKSVIERSPARFACEGSGAVAWRTRQMLRSAEMRIAEMAALPTYVDPLELDAIAVTATCAADAVHAEDPQAMMAAPIPA